MVRKDPTDLQDHKDMAGNYDSSNNYRYIVTKALPTWVCKSTRFLEEAESQGREPDQHMEIWIYLLQYGEIRHLQLFTAIAFFMVYFIYNGQAFLLYLLMHYYF